MTPVFLSRWKSCYKSKGGKKRRQWTLSQHLFNVMSEEPIFSFFFLQILHYPREAAHGIIYMCTRLCILLAEHFPWSSVALEFFSCSTWCSTCRSQQTMSLCRSLARGAVRTIHHEISLSWHKHWIWSIFESVIRYNIGYKTKCIHVPEYFINLEYPKPYGRESIF